MIERWVCGYIRVSTERQAERGVSLSAQQERCEAYARSLGLPCRIFADRGISGSRMDTRPELRAAIALAVRTKGVLVAHSVSRMSRTVLHGLQIVKQLMDAGASFVSLTEPHDTTTPEGALQFTLYMGFAEYERKKIGQRIKSALSYLKTQGRRVSGVIPFGWTLGEGKQLVECPVEQAVLRDMRAMRADGYCFGSIAHALNAKGIRPKRAKAWSKSGVHAVLTREAV